MDRDSEAANAGDTGSPMDAFSAKRFKRIRDRQTDWEADFIDLCQRLWEMLAVGTEIAPSYLQTFVELLLDPQLFPLARLVIPELRAPPTTHANRHTGQRAEVLEATSDLRRVNHDYEAIVPLQLAADELYLGERRIFSDLEMHRMSILLLDTSNLDEDERKSVETWLAARPGIARHSPEHGAYKDEEEGGAKGDQEDVKEEDDDDKAEHTRRGQVDDGSGTTVTTRKWAIESLLELRLW